MERIPALLTVSDAGPGIKNGQRRALRIRQCPSAARDQQRRPTSTCLRSCGAHRTIWNWCVARILRCGLL